jgi:outer membrane receptor protein involved in Fe transport
MAYSQEYTVNHYEFKTDFTWYPREKHTLSFGGNSIIYNLVRGDILPSGDESVRVPVVMGNETGIESAVYISDEFKLLPRLTVYGGLRYSIYSFLGPRTVYKYYPDDPRDELNIMDSLIFKRGEIIRNYSGPELRAAVNYSTGANSSLKASYNRIRQYLFMLTNTIAISPTDQWKLCDYYIKPPYSDQISVGYYKNFPETDLNTSLELYYKKIHNAVDFKDGAVFLTTRNFETELLQGDQSAYGIELMLKKNSGKLNGWISYTYSHSEILINGEHPWEKINSGKSYLANYDIPHAFDLVMNYRINRRLSLSSNIVYSTGRPVTYPLSFYHIDGQPFISYSLRNKYRIPDYFRIDLSINLEGNLKSRKIAHSYWMLNIYNLTGRKNAYSVYFKSEGGRINGYKMSVFGTQIVTLSWNFKLGNYASE